VRSGDVKISAIERGAFHVLRCEGPISLGPGTTAFEAACNEWIGTGRGIVLDLSAVPYIDSTGVAAIVACAESARSQGRVVSLVLAPGGVARRAVEISGLDQFLPIFADVDSAIAGYD
jgi:anti-anti-sigma factor